MWMAKHTHVIYNETNDEVRTAPRGSDDRWNTFLIPNLFSFVIILQLIGYKLAIELKADHYSSQSYHWLVVSPHHQTIQWLAITISNENDILLYIFYIEYINGYFNHKMTTQEQLICLMLLNAQRLLLEQLFFFSSLLLFCQRERK